MTPLAEAEARALAEDAADALAPFRDEFLIPRHPDGSEQTYFCGNSLGLMPRATRAALEDVLDGWEKLGVEAHFRGEHPWMPYHQFVREDLAAVVGALPSEVVAMNSLTANLHFMMVSFYRPTRERPAILIEKHAFPSDRHAVESQIRFHGYDPKDTLIELDGDEPDGTISDAAIRRALDEHGARVALVMLPGVQYRTGQAFDLRAITQAAHAKGCVVGFDPATALIELEGDEPDGTISDAAIEHALEEHGARIALVMLPGVQYRTGQAFDLKRITEAAHRKGCVTGFDLAHAAGNLALQL
ncbi:MAG TPA: hypothetical protein VJ696_09385, partial [Rhodanobacteraceae bacterium]|nr:hypothetical protein [Rhodanobacteraceae bacterium]